MSDMQESNAGGDRSTAAPEPVATQGIFEDHREIVWNRSDWPNPVGWLSELRASPRKSEVREQPFSWQLIEVPLLLLSHNASLLLLQGKSLGEILIPNHFISLKQAPIAQFPIAHVLLRVDPWQCWDTPPKLTGLVLAKLGDIPAGLGAAEVLAALVQDSAA